MSITRQIPGLWMCVMMTAAAFAVIFSCDAPQETAHRGPDDIERRVAAVPEAPTPPRETVEQSRDDLCSPIIGEQSFVPGPRNRDPFVCYHEVLGPDARAVPNHQRPVKMEELDVSSLRLVALVSSDGSSSAMVKTPQGLGVIIKRGDYVGRADFVEAGRGQAPVQINWRVERIHIAGLEETRGVTLVREDPTGRDLTRFIPLHRDRS